MAAAEVVQVVMGTSGSVSYFRVRTEYLSTIFLFYLKAILKSKSP